MQRSGWGETEGVGGGKAGVGLSLLPTLAKKLAKGLSLCRFLPIPPDGCRASFLGLLAIFAAPWLKKVANYLATFLHAIGLNAGQEVQRVSLRAVTGGNTVGCGDRKSKQGPGSETR